MGTVLETLTRNELEAEVMRLRRALKQAEANADLSTIHLHRSDDYQSNGSGRVAADTSAPPVSPRLGEAFGASQATSAINQPRQRARFHCDHFAVILTDPFGVIIDWSSGAEHMMGWTAAEMRGEHISVIFTATDRARGRVEADMQRAMQIGHISDEGWLINRGGRQFWASGQMSVLRDREGSHLGYLRILNDQTDDHSVGRAAVQYPLQRNRLATNLTSDAVWDWDLAKDQISWNEALEQAYGHNLATTGTSAAWWLEHIHPDDRARIDGSIHAFIGGTGVTWSDEYRFLRADGSYAHVLDRGQVIRDAEGRAERVIGAMLDLTRMRAAESALRQSEERFRTILETVDAAFAIVDVKFDANDQPIDYCFVDANPAFERQTGVDLRGKWVTEFAPDLERFWFETYGHVARTGEAANFESYAQAFERWFDVRAVRVGDPADRQIAILFNDVTERREAEERLRVSEALARENVDRVQLALAAGAIIGTWNWDLPNDRFTVDEGFAYAFGLDPAIGRDGLSLEQIVQTVHPEDRPGLTDAISEVIARGGAYAHQYRVRRADGKYYWIEANGRVDLTDDGTPLSFPGVLIDVEDRRSIEAERDRATAALRALNETLEQRVAERTAELIQAEDKLRQSQKMEAVGQLTGGLAHDFNNLLAGISGALELISARIAQRRLDDIDKYMIAAQGAAKRAAALTHRLLAFSRRQTLDPRPIDVNMLVEGMTELIQRTVGPSIRIETRSEKDPWLASVDASQLENAILNLCINSRDAMPDGGQISIETSNRCLDRSAAKTYELPEGQYLCLCVADTGTGMTPSIIAKAFDPFFTTKPIGQGTGLGLSMIYGFAKQSGGQARISSEVGKGTAIHIYLPRYHGPAVLGAAYPTPLTARLAEARGTILIVDDEPSVRMLLVDALGDLGFSLIEAADSLDGLKILQSDASIDLLITDVGLPGGMNGRQMADAGRQIRPNLKTLFITGYAENAVLGDASLGPGMQVLTKPFGIDTLTSRVLDLLNK